MHRLEEAHEPEDLAQETIIENLDPEEAARLSKIRNIGIAVSLASSVDNYCAIR
jgi:elongation factor G